MSKNTLSNCMREQPSEPIDRTLKRLNSLEIKLKSLNKNLSDYLSSKQEKEKSRTKRGSIFVIINSIGLIAAVIAIYSFYISNNISIQGFLTKVFTGRDHIHTIANYLYLACSLAVSMVWLRFIYYRWMYGDKQKKGNHPLLWTIMIIGTANLIKLAMTKYQIYFVYIYLFSSALLVVTLVVVPSLRQIVKCFLRLLQDIVTLSFLSDQGYFRYVASHNKLFIALLLLVWLLDKVMSYYFQHPFYMFVKPILYCVVFVFILRFLLLPKPIPRALANNVFNAALLALIGYIVATILILSK